jgi:hypothetical protein
MPDRMTTTADDAKARAGRIGGRVTAERMTPEARSERARAASLGAAVSTIEKRWDEMPEPMKARILARVSA